jgi:hypothetical protein
MENLNRFEKWYSNYVIKHYKEPISVKIVNTENFGWRIQIEFKKESQTLTKELKESERKSNFNYFSIQANDNTFFAECDFTKLDFVFGKFMAYIGDYEGLTLESDHFLKDDIQRFIFEHEKEAFIFLHYTPERTSAESIIRSGFRFNVAFDKTTVGIQNDATVINYNHIVRKPFGKYVMVICISKEIYYKYSELIAKSEDKYLKVEEILTESAPVDDEFLEKTYTLHHKFIKGYINYSNGQIVKNPEYDFKYDNDLFYHNIFTK